MSRTRRFANTQRFRKTPILPANSKYCTKTTERDTYLSRFLWYLQSQNLKLGVILKLLALELTLVPDPWVDYLDGPISFWPFLLEQSFEFLHVVIAFGHVVMKQHGETVFLEKKNSSTETELHADSGARL